ncbi:MAG: bile acid-coenzyme ligase [Actinomycetota bacterium]|jgi:bile acid-coenzyme A ligase|nr:bile acid-coenzyme ligase [Actinomycetota bacterium]
MSIGRAFGWHAEQDPDRPSVTDSSSSVSRRELDLASNRLARAYGELGVRRDDLVTIGLPNSVEYFVACAAVWKLGATPQPVSAKLPPAELEAVVDLADPPLLVGLDLPGRNSVPAGFDASGYDDAPLPDSVAASWKAPTSGGSTGRPKLILSGTPGEVDPSIAAVPYIPRDGVQLVPGPLYHNGPFIYSMRGLLSGQSLVVMERFDAERVLQLVEQQRVTWMLLVPTMMQRIWRLPESVRSSYDVSSLEMILHLGAPCPAWLKRAWIDWLGPERVVELYAGTESQGVTVIDGREWLERPGSVGRPVLGSRFRVLDEHGRDVPAGTVGEIYMMPADGPGTTYTYRGAEPRGVDGWESLGDLGHLDEDGYLYLADRSADLILSGGANVYPAEVEAAIDAHPAVRSSAVIGLPDDDLGERVHAVVDIAEHDVSTEALLAHVRERLVRYKVPRTIEIVREPLRDDAGKIRRSALRAARLP